MEGALGTISMSAVRLLVGSTCAAGAERRSRALLEWTELAGPGTAGWHQRHLEPLPTGAPGASRHAPHLVRPQPQRQLRLGEDLVCGADELHGQQLLPAVVPRLDNHAPQVPPRPPAGARGSAGRLCGAVAIRSWLPCHAWASLQFLPGATNSFAASTARRAQPARQAHLPCGDAVCTLPFRDAHRSPYAASATCFRWASSLSSAGACLPPLPGPPLGPAGRHTGKHATAPPGTCSCWWSAGKPCCGRGGSGDEPRDLCCCCCCCAATFCCAGGASGWGRSGAGSLCCLATLRMASCEGMRWCLAGVLRIVRSGGGHRGLAGNRVNGRGRGLAGKTEAPASSRGCAGAGTRCSTAPAARAERGQRGGEVARPGTASCQA